ncbi:MAG: hypothetical protein NTY74_12535 [Ignavibacteriae bacterium]|nr:hypothetical protein [Ignavibacteriota bacterium]
MAQHNVLDNNTISKVINSIPGKHFTTITVVKILESDYPAKYNELKINSPRNFQSVIGVAIKRYLRETNKITQLSPQEESPARWEKKNA